MRWQSDQNLQLNNLLNKAWTLTEPENKLYCSYEYSSLFHLKATRVKKLSRKPLLCAVHSSVISNECLPTHGLEMSSALAPMNWNLKGKILHRLLKSFSSEFFFGCCRPWNRLDSYLPPIFRKKTTWSTKILEEEMSISYGREQWW